MKNTKEKELLQEQNKNERKNVKRLALILTGIIVVILAIVFGKLILDKESKVCESHVDTNLDLICDECKIKIPCLDEKSHADVNNDFLCDNCGAAIAISDVPVYKEIANEEDNGEKVNVRGEMPSDTKLETAQIEKEEAVKLAMQYLDVKESDVIAGYDISLKNQKNIKYQPIDNNGNVKVTISNLNVDPSTGLAMLHIMDDGHHELIGLSRATSNEIEFVTNHFSTYILVTVGTNKVEFSGLGTYNVLDENNIPLVSGVTIASQTNFKFWIMPVSNYVVTNVVLKDSSGNVINPSTDGSTVLKMSDYGLGKACEISSISQDYTVSVTNVISLDNQIGLTAVTDGEWTNQDIVVEIDWPVTSFTNQIKLDNGAWQDYSEATYTMTANGTLYARVFDGDQGGAETSVTIGNIDKVAPVISNVKLSNTEWTTGSVSVIFSASDATSGIVSYVCSTAEYYANNMNYYPKVSTKITATNSIVDKTGGSTSVTTTYYIRCADAAGNMSATKTISVSKIDEREPLFSSTSAYTNAQFNLYKTYGTQKFTDAAFASGYNSLGIYNNAGNGNVTRERVTIASEGIDKCPVSSSGYVIKMQNKGNASPGLGGFVQSLNVVPDGVYIHRFYAKVPVGYSLNTANNSISGTRTWITATTGTGEWQEYAYIWRCNSSGRFDDFGYIYLSGNVGTVDNPVVWYVGYATMYDVTHIWDDIDVSYDETNAATLTIKAYDYASGIKSITVNGTEATIDTSASTYTNDVLTMAVVNYKITEAGTYKIVATDNAGRTSTLTRTAYSITYNPNAPSGATVTGTTVNQIKIGSTSNARLSMDGSKYVWKVTLRSNGYTNSAGTPFRGWATSATGLPAYAAGAVYQDNASLNLYAVWNEAIQWDVSSAGDGSVIASLITNSDGSTYTLKITGTGTMKSWDWKDYSSAPWYSYRASISNISVESGVTNVGSYAFFNITGIKDAANISLASSVKTLGTKCFGSCSSMKGTFVIPSTVTYAPFNPFQSCSSLEAIEVDANNQYYKSIDGVMFNKAGTTLIAYPLGNGLTHYDIPEGTVTIYNESFVNMTASTISIPSTVTTFNDLCFSGADLVTLSIPNTVTTLSGRPFTNLDHIEKIYYHPTNVTLPHNSTFTNAKSGSVIYTANKAIAGGFVDGTDYTSSRTTLAYPPYFSTHPSNVTIGEGEQTTFTAVVTDGVPAGTVTVQWQYRESSTADWKDVTSAQGTITTSGTTTKLTTVAATLAMNGYEYRCKTGNGIYPGTVSQFTEEEIASSIISKAARLTIIEKNYSYNSAYYATIQEALAVFYNDNVSSTSSRTGTITMLDSVVDESDFVVKADYKVTLNTNGHTLTRTSKSIINNGRLTLSGIGTITTASESANAVIDTLIQNNSEVIVNGATIKHRGMVSSNYYAIANMTASSTITVNSGTVTEAYGLDSAGTGKGSAIYTNVASTITVNGGNVLAKSSASSTAIKVETDDAAKVYIYGGTVESTLGTGVEINSASTSTTTTAMLYGDGGTINGGIYGVKYGANTTNTLRVNGATVWGGTSGVISYGTGEVLLMSGTIDSDTAAITTASDAPVSIKGGTITGPIGILNNTGNSAKVTIYAGTINTTTYGVQNKGTGEIRFETGKITATTYGIYNEGAGTIRVLGGTIEAGARGIRDAGNGTIIIGAKDNIINTTTPVVQGEYYGVYAEDSSIFNFYDGKLKGKTAALIDGTADDIEEEHSIFKTQEGQYKVATLQTGWDISPEGATVSTAWAVLEPDPTDNEKYMITITGSGAMRNFTETSVPWLGYRHLVKTVSLQEGITNIGDNALYNCIALEAIEIPSTVTTIGNYAFANCTSVIGGVEIPAKVTSMGTNPFSNATVESFTVASGNTSFKAVDGVLMNAAGTTIVAFPIGTSSSSYTMPNTVVTINDEAFLNSTLSEITLSTSLKTVGDKAFNGSKNISLLVIPTSVTSVGADAFGNMSTLSECYFKPTSVSIGDGAFVNMPVGSVIYTISYDIATQFTSDIYTTNRTTIYYPPRITVQPLDQELTCPEPGVFIIEATNGVPSGIAYQWYIKEKGSSIWRTVEASDGAGGTTNTFTTVNTENAMAGLSYRCIITNSYYPNAYMTEDELASEIVSSVATLAVSGGNYQLNSNLYYSTLEAALEAAGDGTHTIDVMVSVEDSSTPIIDANQTITLKMNEKEIEKLTEKIVNNGTLTIVGGGKIETDKDASSATNILITNNGVLSLSDTALIHNGKTDAGFYAVQNYGTFNMTSGTVEAQLSSAIATTGNYACRGITNFSGIVNISGGTVSANYNRNTSTSTVSAAEVAYAIEAWREISYTGAVGEINISGNANITSNCNAIVMKYDTTSETVSESNISITGGTITGGYYGIWSSANTKGSIAIADATVTGTNAAISLNASYPVTLTVDNTTITSSTGNGIESLSAGNTVTINEDVRIDAKTNGIDFEAAGTYTQNEGNITGGTNGVKLNSQGEKVTANIKAGTLIGTSGSGISIPSTATKVSLNVSGGTITGSTNGIEFNANSTSDLTITDATVSTTGTSGVAVNVNSSATTVNIGATSGGAVPTITGTATGVKLTNVNTSNLNSGTISGKVGIELANANMNLKAGTINGTDIGAKVTGTSTLTIDGGLIDSSSCAINLADSAVLTINSGDITSNNTGIETAGTSTLNMNDGNVNVSIYGIVNKGSGNINVGNGTVFAGEIGISNESSFTGKLTIGVDDSNVSKALPEIRSIEGVKAANGFYFYDGILKGILVAKDGEVLASPDGYNFFEDTETIDGKTYKTFYMDRGWNISADESVDNVWAFIEETATGNRLVIRGTGKSKDFAYVNDNYDNIPWYQFRDSVTEIVVQNGVTRIGDRTFAKSNQVTVSLAEGLKELGDYVFASSTDIGSNVTIPSTVTTIEANPFILCSNLKTITVTSGNANFTAINGVLYSADGTKLVSYPIGNTATEFTIPTAVTHILDSAFMGSQKLTKVVIGDNLTSVASRAFYNATTIKEVYIRSTVISSLASQSFVKLASGSVIYTMNKTTANKFVNDYESGAYSSTYTTVYYPPVIATQPVSQLITIGNTVKFSIDVTTGVPTSVTYTWQYRTSSTDSWKNATTSIGSGINTNTLTITSVPSSYNNYQFRCVVANSAYPNTYMTNDELKLTSDAAILTLNAPNYKVGSVYYNTLKEAVDSITTSTATTITANLDNTEITAVTIPSGRNIVLDLAGKTVNASGLKTGAFITNNGTLELKDSASNGKIDITQSEATGNMYVVSNSGTLNVTSGTYSIQISKYYPCVIKNTAGTTTINGGTISSISTEESEAGWCVAIFGESGTINVNGGYINVNNKNSNIRASCVRTQGIGEVDMNIRGGKIEAIGMSSVAVRITKKDGEINYNTNLEISENAELIASGDSDAYAIYNENGVLDINIKGGTLKGTTSAIRNIASNTNIGTAGGSVSTTSPVLVSEGIAVYSTQNVNFYDGVIKAKNDIFSVTGTITPETGYGIQYTNDGTYNNAILVVANYSDGTSCYATLKDAFELATTGATITAMQNVTDASNATVPSGKTFTLDLGTYTITKTSYAITNEGTLNVQGSGTLQTAAYGTNTLTSVITNTTGTLNVKAGTIHNQGSSSKDCYAIEITGGTVNVSGGTVKGTNAGAIHLASSATSAKLAITDGTVSATGTNKSAIKNDGLSTVTIGTSGSSVSTTAPVIRGEKYGVEIVNDSAVFNFYDGNIGGKTATISGTIDSVPNTYVLTYDTDGDYKTVYLLEGHYIIGTTYYVTLEDAVNAISSTGTIKVTKAYTDASNPVIASGKNITLDLNAKTITKTTNPISTSGTLTITDNASTSGTIKTSTLEHLIVQNAGTLTMQKGKLTHSGLNATKTWSAIHVLGGTQTNVNGGTITAENASKITGSYGRTILIEGNTTFTMNGGTVKTSSTVGEMYPILSWQSGGTSTINITAGTIENASAAGDAISIGYTTAVNATNLNITGGTIISKNGKGVNYNGAGKFVLGDSSNAINSLTPEFTTKDVTIASNNGFEWYDGILKSQNTGVYNATINATVPKCEPLFDTEDISGVTYYKAWLEIARNYKVDSIYYAVLGDIIEIHPEGADIQLLKDCTDDSEVVFPAGQTYTLELGTKTITKTTYPIVNNAKLTITGSGNIVTADCDNLIENTGTLVIDNAGQFTNTIGMGINQTAGSVTISKATITANTTGLYVASGTTAKFNGEMIRGKQKAIDGKATAPTDMAIYFYEDATYKYAVLKTGWIISKSTSDDVTAYILENESNPGTYTLSIVGTGAMKNFTASGAPWMENYKELVTAIEIGSGVTNVGTYAFNGMSNVKTISLPTSMTAIENYAFSGCSKVTSLTIPASVTSIGCSFGNMSSLNSISVTSGNTVFETDGIGLYNKNTSRLITTTNATSYSIKDGTIYIGIDAMSGRTIGALTLPSTLTTISENALNGVKGLSIIIIPEAVKTIGKSAFANATELITVYLQTSSTTLGSGAFTNLPAGSSIYVLTQAIGKNKFTSSIYTSANTTVKYPPKATATFGTKTVDPMKTLTLDVGVSNGVPADTSFKWQIKEPGATEWTDLTEGTGYNTAVYTTVPITLDMVGTQYRCVLSSSAYPNQYMTIENTALAGELISAIATIAISNTTMNTEWEVTSSGQTVTLPISGNVNVSVDWGDGNIETITTDNPTHKYASAGTYQIRVGGTCDMWGTNSNVATYTQIMTKVNQWGELGASKYSFAGCTKLTYVSPTISATASAAITDMSNMFASCTGLTSIDLSKFDTSNVTTMESMFMNATGLTTLNLSKLNTGNVQYMQQMFYGCTGLTSLNLTNLDTSSVIAMQNMFNGCSALKTLDLKDFNTSNVGNMGGMFVNASALQVLHLGSEFDRFAGVSMFEGANALTAIIAQKVDAMELNAYAFDNSSSNIILYVMNQTAETAYENATNYSTALGADRIKPILALKGASKVVIDMGTIYNESADEGVYVAGFDKSGKSNYTGIGYSVKIDGLPVNTDGPATYTVTFTAVYDSADLMSVTRTVKVVDANKLMTREAPDIVSGTEVYYAIGASRANKKTYKAELIKTITLVESPTVPADALDSWDASFYLGDEQVYAWVKKNTTNTSMYDLYLGGNEVVIAPPDSTNLFGEYPNLTSISGLSLLDANEATTFERLFYNDVNLTSIDSGIANWKVASVTDTSYAFAGCIKLTQLDLSGWKTTALTDMSNMFDGCTQLSTLNIATFNTSKVTTFKEAFNDCSNLATLTEPSWNTSSAINMNSMFNGCAKLTTLNTDGWNVTNLESAAGMFNGCTLLTNIDVSDWETNKLTNSSEMFKGCAAITTLDLTSWNTGATTNMASMFENCSNLEILLLGNNVDKLNGASMFAGCNSLQKIIAERRAATSSDAMTLSSDTGLNAISSVILYVWDSTSEKAYEGATNYETVFGADRIRNILALRGDSYVAIHPGETYTDAGVTVMGYNNEDDSVFKALGYTVKMTTDLDTKTSGRYEVIWTLYKPSTTVVTTVMREIYVRHIPVTPTITVTQKNNGNVIESGTWASGDLLIKLSGSSYGSGEFEYIYSFDQENWVVASEITHTGEVASKILYAKARGVIDNGDISEAATFEIKVDTTIPAITAANRVGYNGVNEVYGLTIADGTISSEMAKFAISSENDLAKATWYAYGDVEIPDDGTWYLWVQDVAGNISNSFEIVTTDQYKVEATYGGKTIKYVDVLEAIEAIETNSATTATIKLLDENNVDVINISSGYTVALDLNGNNLNTTGIVVAGKLTLKDSSSDVHKVTIDSTELELVVVRGEMIIDGNIEINSLDNPTEVSMLISVYSGAKFTMNNGTIKGFENLVAISNAGTTTILNGTVTSTSTTKPTIENVGSITLGKQDTNVSVTLPRIEGNYKVIETIGELYFYDGILSANNSTVTLDGPVTTVQTGYHLIKTTNGTTNEMYLDTNETVIDSWDISETSSDNVYAEIRICAGDGISDNTKYELTIAGTGKAKDFTVSYNDTDGWVGNHPWYAGYKGDIISLNLEEGVTKYGDYMFFNLEYVTSIKFPESLTYLGDRACYKMKSLTGTVNIPAAIATIETNPFARTNITKYTVASANTAYVVANGAIVTIDGKRLVSYPNGATTTKPTVADGVEYIDALAFCGTKNAETVNLPNTLKCIEAGAFENTTGLEYITIPSSVTNIIGYAFNNSSDLKNVYLKSESFGIFETAQTFTNLAQGSIIYTESKEIADLFIADTTYTSSKTQVYYPFKVMEELGYQAIARDATLTIEPEIRDGYIASDVSYQWYQDGKAISGATSPVYTKTMFTDSDEGMYKLVIKSAKQSNGEYYYTVETNEAEIVLGDFEAPESITTSVKYNEDGTATVTITANDKESGVDEIAVNGELLAVTKNTKTGSAVGSFTVSQVGTFEISATDYWDNTSTISTRSYEITYSANTTGYTGETAKQIKIHDFDINLRKSGSEKVGHAFTGWNTKADGTGTTYAEEAVYSGNGNIEFYGTWQILSYIVKFYNDDGINGNKVVAEAEYVYGTAITVPGLQYKTATEVGDSTYRIYYHNENWIAEKQDPNAKENPVNITSSNKGSIVMIDSDVNYYAEYSYIDNDINHKTVSLDGKMSVTGDEYGIYNDEGLIILGESSTSSAKPTITGSISLYNNNGIVLWYNAGFSGPTQGLIAKK